MTDISEFQNRISKTLEGTGAEWVQNVNYPNNYTLEKKVLILGKSWLHDKTQRRIFGWTEQQEYGEYQGLIAAYIPIIPDEEDDAGSDCEIIGHFDSVLKAMEAIIEHNHPQWGICI